MLRRYDISAFPPSGTVKMFKILSHDFNRIYSIIIGIIRRVSMIAINFIACSDAEL